MKLCDVVLKSKIIPIIVPIWRKNGLHCAQTLEKKVEEIVLVDGPAS